MCMRTDSALNAAIPARLVRTQARTPGCAASRRDGTNHPEYGPAGADPRARTRKYATHGEQTAPQHRTEPNRAELRDRSSHATSSSERSQSRSAMSASMDCRLLRLGRRFSQYAPESQSIPARRSASQTSWSAPFSGEVKSVSRATALVVMNLIIRLVDWVPKLVAMFPGWNAAAETPDS